MLGALGLLCAGVAAVIVFFPPEGLVGVPLHAGVRTLLGRAAFMLPLGLAFVGGLALIRARRPTVVLPRRRLVGLGLLALTLLPAEQLLGGSDGAGLVGERLAATLVSIFGGPVTAFALAIGVAVGTLLAFDVKLARHREETSAAS